MFNFFKKKVTVAPEDRRLAHKRGFCFAVSEYFYEEKSTKEISAKINSLKIRNVLGQDFVEGAQSGILLIITFDVIREDQKEKARHAIKRTNSKS